MDHRAFITSLDPQEKAALHARSTARGLVHLAGHFGALSAMGAYIALHGPLWGLMMLPYGIALMFLFTLSHECTHKTPFAQGWLNDLVGHLVSVPLLLPFIWFRYFHLAHHTHTNDPQLDPELAGGGRPDNRRAYLLTVSGWGYWRASAVTLWQHARGRVTAPYLPARRHRAIVREARIVLAVHALLILSLMISPLALYLLYIPALIGQPFLRLYLLAEHGLCPPVANMLENTRTTLTNRVVRFLAWNMPYHAEHHAMPMVPFHALPRLHDRVRGHLKSVSNSYAEFSRDYLDSLGRSQRAD